MKRDERDINDCHTVLHLLGFTREANYGILQEHEPWETDAPKQLNMDTNSYFGGILWILKSTTSQTQVDPPSFNNMHKNLSDEQFPMLAQDFRKLFGHSHSEDRLEKPSDLLGNIGSESRDKNLFRTRTRKKICITLNIFLMSRWGFLCLIYCLIMFHIM